MIECQRTGCCNPAVARAGVSFTAYRCFKKVNVEFYMPLYVCELHKVGDPHEYISETGWLRLSAMMISQGYTECIGETLSVIYRPTYDS